MRLQLHLAVGRCFHPSMSVKGSREVVVRHSSSSTGMCYIQLRGAV